MGPLPRSSTTLDGSVQGCVAFTDTLAIVVPIPLQSLFEAAPWEITVEEMSLLLLRDLLVRANSIHLQDTLCRRFLPTACLLVDLTTLEWSHYHLMASTFRCGRESCAAQCVSTDASAVHTTQILTFVEKVEGNMQYFISNFKDECFVSWQGTRGYAVCGCSKPLVASKHGRLMPVGRQEGTNRYRGRTLYRCAKRHEIARSFTSSIIMNSRNVPVFRRVRITMARRNRCRHFEHLPPPWSKTGWRLVYRFENKGGSLSRHFRGRGG